MPVPRDLDAGLSVREEFVRAVGPRTEATGRKNGLPHRPPAQMDDSQATGTHDELLEVISYAIGQLERDRVPDVAGRCLQFTEAVLAGLFPQGIKPPAGARSADDAAASADLSARRWLNQPPDAWEQVRSWEAVFETVTGHNTATVVIVGSRKISHALILINTTGTIEGVKVLDYDGHTAVLNDFTPVMTDRFDSPLGAVAFTRALHISLTTAQPLTGRTTTPRLSSRDIVAVLTGMASPHIGMPKRKSADSGANPAGGDPSDTPKVSGAKVTVLANKLITAMKDKPQTGKDLNDLKIPVAVRAEVFAKIEELRPGAFRIWKGKGKGGTVCYGPLDKVPAGTPSQSIAESTDAVTLLANKLITAMEDKPQTGTELDRLGIRGAVRAEVFAKIEKLRPRAFGTWKTGSTVCYGPLAKVPAGTPSRSIAESTDAVTLLANKLITAMEDKPQTGKDLKGLKIPGAVRAEVFAKIEELRPRAFGTWRGKGSSVCYGPLDKVPEGTPSRPIAESTDAVTLLANKLITAMEDKPQTGKELDRLKIPVAVRAEVFAKVEELRPGAFGTWRGKGKGGTVLYGPLAKVPAGTPSRSIAESTDAVTPLANKLITALEDKPQTGTELDRLGIRGAVCAGVFAKVEELRPGAFGTWKTGSTVLYGPLAKVPAGTPSRPIAEFTDAVTLLANKLITAMEDKPQTGNDLNGLGILVAVRAGVFAKVEELRPGAFGTWKTGSTVLYGPLAKVPAGTPSRSIAESTDAVTLLANKLITAMEDKPQTGKDLNDLGIRSAVRAEVFAKVEELRPGAFGTWKTGKTGWYGPLPKVPAGTPSRPIAEFTDAVTLLANELITAMDKEPQTGNDLNDLGILVAVRAGVFAKVEELRPGAFKTWKGKGTGVCYGPLAKVPEGTPSRPIAEFTDAVTLLANKLITAMDKEPQTGNDLKGLGIPGAVRAGVFAKVEELRPGAFGTWKTGKTGWYGPLAKVPARTPSRPIAASTDADGFPGSHRPLNTAPSPSTDHWEAVPNDRQQQQEQQEQREQVRRFLEQELLELVEVAHDGDCFYMALKLTLEAMGVVPVDELDVPQMRAMFAQALENPAIRGLIPDSVLAIAEQEWRAAYDSAYELAVADALQSEIIDPRLLEADHGDLDPWKQIADQIRTPRGWADQGGDLVPWLAPHVFPGLPPFRIRLLHPNSTGTIGQTIIGDTQSLMVTLAHPTNHWDATRPAQLPLEMEWTGGDGTSDGAGADGSDAGGPDEDPDPMDWDPTALQAWQEVDGNDPDSGTTRYDTTRYDTTRYGTTSGQSRYDRSGSNSSFELGAPLPTAWHNNPRSPENNSDSDSGYGTEEETDNDKPNMLAAAYARDPRLRALQKGLPSKTSGSPTTGTQVTSARVGTTGHHRPPGPYITHDNGIPWAASSHSGYGPDKACVEVTVITLR
ncbi:hypothetical protein [Actinoallomurus spadix]|uniref:hypothetical protein n=1 Tax=Actinoallomurus spadix TaxID=79912 RepID=UPI0031D377BB